MFNFWTKNRSLAPFLLILLATGVHLFSGGAVYPADDPDYVVHLGIVEQLKRGEVFPLQYSGIIGGHAAAALVSIVTGLAAPKVMLLLTDGALVAAAWAIGRVSLVGGAAVLLVTLPFVAQMEARGFYGHALSMGPYAVAVALHLRGRSVFAALSALAGASVYPDGVMWLLPAIAWRNRPAFVAALGVSGFILWRQLGLGEWTGAAKTDWTPAAIFAGALAAIAVWKRGKWTDEERRGGTIAIAYVVVVLLVISVNVIAHGKVNYYAKKNLYPLAIMLPFAASVLANRARTAVIAALAVFAGLSALPKPWIRLGENLARFVQPRSPFDLEDLACASKLRALSCASLAILPASQSQADDEPWQRAVRLGGYAIYSGTQASAPNTLKGFEDTDNFAIAERLRPYPRTLADLEAALPQVRSVECVVVDTSLKNEPVCEFGDPDRRSLAVIRR